MTYTKGEWIVKAHQTGHCWRAEVRTPDKKEDGHIVAYSQLIAACYGKNTVANAHLIAAAPEMYEVLKAISAVEQTTGKVCSMCGGYLEHAKGCIFVLAEGIITKVEATEAVL